MKRRLAGLTLAAILLVLSASHLYAQGEITLEGLAEQLAALTGRVGTLELRTAAPVTEDGRCILLQRDFDIQPETATKFLDAFGVFPKDSYLGTIYFDSMSGQVGFIYRESSDYSNLKYVTEFWKGCEFAGSSDWRLEE
jgi:hypothetical protein